MNITEARIQRSLELLVDKHYAEGCATYGESGYLIAKQAEALTLSHKLSEAMAIEQLWPECVWPIKLLRRECNGKVLERWIQDNDGAKRTLTDEEYTQIKG